MTFTIAMAGKGGTGKTSIASLIIRYLLNHGGAPVLAVDADPAANLGLSLGLEIRQTVGSVISNFNENKIAIPQGLSKESFLDLRLNETIVESRGFDLITMGRGEGSGCYCFPNNVLKNFVDRLLPNYKFMVMDNEAGLEHLSRGTTEHVDELLIVSNHSVKGIRTVETILKLVDELKLDIRHKNIVINQAPSPIDTLVGTELDRAKISPSALIPDDPLIMEFDWHQRSLLEMPDGALSVISLGKLMDRLISN